MLVTPYGLDSLEIALQWGAKFSTPIHTGPGVNPASYIVYWVIPGGKVARAWR